MALSVTRKKLLDSLVEQGLTLKRIQKQHGFNYATIRKYYPDYRNQYEANWKDYYASIPEETIKLIETMLEDKAPLIVIEEVTGVRVEKIEKLYPGRAWTKAEAGSLGGTVSVYAKTLYGPLSGN